MIEISKVIYSRRKSLSVSVMENGEIVVKAPLGLSMPEIQRFLNEKQSWIENKLNKVSSIQDKFREVIEYRQLLVFGKAYYGYSSSSVNSISLMQDRILISSKIQPEKLHGKITNWKVLESKKLLKVRAEC